MTATVDIALPVLNEESGLERSVLTLLEHLQGLDRYRWQVSIVDNGSSDRSWALAAGLARRHEIVRALRLERPGRGGALRAAWTTSRADVLAYMDIDLSTGLDALPAVVGPVADGRADVAIGSRLAPGAQVTRGLPREAISHVYNMIARLALRYPVRDAQCGFKAVSRAVVERIVPQVVDESWFFDTELLALAWRAGMRIHEQPVRWVEDHDSRVRIASTAVDDLRGIWRIRRPATTQALSGTATAVAEAVPPLAAPEPG